MENCLAVVRKRNMRLLYDPALPRLDPYTREVKTHAHTKTHYENIRNSFIHDSPKWKSTHQQGMDKKMVVWSWKTE